MERHDSQDYANRITLPNGYVVSIVCQWNNAKRCDSPGACVGLFDAGSWTVNDEGWVDEPRGHLTFQEVADFIEEVRKRPSVPTKWEGNS